MGLALVFLSVCICVGAIVWFSCKVTDPSRFKNAVTGFIISVLVLGSISTAFIVGSSYSSYLDNRAFYDATIEQYRGAVEMYKDYAVIDMDKTREAFTDFKYQGYQKQIASMIFTLQRRIVKYNRVFIKKKRMVNSWFFNWYIITNDPDMKIIRMIEKEKKLPQSATPAMSLSGCMADQ